jgi:hypothetical protein
MLKIFKNTRLYQFKKNVFTKIIHTELIATDLLIILKLNIELQPELLEMLDNIVAALKIDRNKLEYIVFPNTIDLNQIAIDYQTKNILVFGATTNELTINMDLVMYNAYRFNGFELLMVNDILEVYGNKNLKSKLWNALKEMFS